jgi:hypothetical protein
MARRRSGGPPLPGFGSMPDDTMARRRRPTVLLDEHVHDPIAHNRRVEQVVADFGPSATTGSAPSDTTAGGRAASATSRRVVSDARYGSVVAPTGCSIFRTHHHPSGHPGAGRKAVPRHRCLKKPTRAATSPPSSGRISRPRRRAHVFRPPHAVNASTRALLAGNPVGASQARGWLTVTGASETSREPRSALWYSARTWASSMLP